MGAHVVDTIVAAESAKPVIYVPSAEYADIYDAVYRADDTPSTIVLAPDTYMLDMGRGSFDGALRLKPGDDLVSSLELEFDENGIPLDPTDAVLETGAIINISPLDWYYNVEGPAVQGRNCTIRGLTVLCDTSPSWGDTQPPGIEITSTDDGRLSRGEIIGCVAINTGRGFTVNVSPDGRTHGIIRQCVGRGNWHGGQVVSGGSYWDDYGVEISDTQIRASVERSRWEGNSSGITIIANLNGQRNDVDISTSDNVFRGNRWWAVQYFMGANAWLDPPLSEVEGVIGSWTSRSDLFEENFKAVYVCGFAVGTFKDCHLRVSLLHPTFRMFHTDWPDWSEPQVYVREEPPFGPAGHGTDGATIEVLVRGTEGGRFYVDPLDIDGVEVILLGAEQAWESADDWSVPPDTGNALWPEL
jgi:hypothetical protein